MRFSAWSSAVSSSDLQTVPVNPAGSVRGPAHAQRRGKTPVLAPDEARRLPDSIDVITHAGLRDRALIGLMVYSFARIGAALAMRVEDVFMQNRRLWVRLHEKGGKRHEMPCHHNLEDYRSEEHTSELQSPMRNSYAVLRLTKTKKQH